MFYLHFTHNMFRKNLTIGMMAFMLFTSSWQVWDQLNNKLTVYSAPGLPAVGTKSCFEGGAEWYDGHCTEGGNPTYQYNLRVQMENEAKNKI